MNPGITNVKIKHGWDAARVSTPNQGKVQHGSLEQQENRMKRFLAQVYEETGCKYHIVRTIAEKKSGKREKFHLRVEFQELIRAIETRQIDFVVFENVSRMGRWARKNLEVIELATDNGIEVWFIDGGHYNHRNKGDRIKFGINNLMAEEESKDNEERVSKKQREAMVNNGKDCSTRPTVGLDAHPQKVCMYVPNYDELKIVVDTMEKFCELKSLKGTVHYCHEKGYKTKEYTTKESVDQYGNIKPPRRTGGEPFDESRLRALLCNPKYRGYNFFKDEFDQFPKLQDENKMVRWEYAHFKTYGQLIDPSLLFKVDETLKRFERHRPRTSKFGNKYFLTGILKDHNGNPFYGSSGKSGEHPYYYNRVSDSSERKTVKKDEIESFATNRLKQFFRESGTLKKVVEAALKNRLVGIPLIEEEIPKMQAKVRELETVIERFSELIRETVLKNNHNLNDVHETLVVEKQKAEKELPEYQTQLKALLDKKEQILARFGRRTLDDYIKRVMAHFDQKSDDEKKALIQAIIPEIIIHEDNSIELRLNPDPNGIASPCHGGGSVSVLCGNWRDTEVAKRLASSTPYIPDFPGSLYSPLYKDKQFLHQKYVVEKLSAAQIASQISSSKTAVLKHLREFGFQVRAPHKPHGRPSQPRYGQRKKDGKATPHLAEQRVIKAIADMRSQKLSLRQIASFLDQIGVPTKCRGKRWHPEMVKRVLSQSVAPSSGLQPDRELHPQSVGNLNQCG